MGRRQAMHTVAAEVMESKLQLLNHVIDIFNDFRLNKVENRNKAIMHMEFIVNCIARNDDRFTTQEINDIQNEIGRFNRMMQLFTISEANTFNAVLNQHKITELNYEKAKAFIFSITPFTKEHDQQVCV